jgi:hypothetical protein
VSPLTLPLPLSSNAIVEIASKSLLVLSTPTDIPNSLFIATSRIKYPFSLVMLRLASVLLRRLLLTAVAVHRILLSASCADLLLDVWTVPSRCQYPRSMTQVDTRPLLLDILVEVADVASDFLY